MRLKIAFVALLCVIIAVSGSENISNTNVPSEKSSKIVESSKVAIANTIEKLKVEVIHDKVSELDEDEEDNEFLEEKFDDVIQIPSSSSSPTEALAKSNESKSGKLELDPAVQNTQYDPNYNWGKLENSEKKNPNNVPFYTLFSSVFRKKKKNV